jgi:hypothetical protein
MFGAVFLGGLLFAGMKFGDVQKETTNCTLGTCPLVIHENDSGKTFHYNVATRFSVILDSRKDPPARLRCVPDGVIGAITNAEEQEPPLYSARFETVSAGTCILQSERFSAAIVVGS